MSGDDVRSAERRQALVDAARRLTAEAGPDCAPLMDPGLAVEIILAASADVAAEIEARTAAGVDSVEALVHALIDAVLAGCAPWADAMPLVSGALARITDFEQWSRVVGAWVGAVEEAIARAQRRGLVHAHVDPAMTALVLRDALHRTAHSAIRFELDEAREATAALMIAALRPAVGSRPATG